MKSRLLISTTTCILAVSSYASNITTLDSAIPGAQGWSDGTAVNQTRNGGAVAITTANPRSGNASLEFDTTTGSQKATAIYNQNGSLGMLSTLGALVDGGSLSYDFYRDSSSTVAAHFAPVLRLYVANLDVAGKVTGTATLIYEQTYNALAITPGQWQSVDVTSANFWMYSGSVIEKFDYSLADWASGATSGNSLLLSSSTVVYGIDTGVGSGWNGVFKGYVDNVHYQAGDTDYLANFETPAPVPDAGSTAILLASAFGIMIAIRRSTCAS